MRVPASGQAWWYVARSSGIVAWALAALAVLWGLALSTRALGRRPRAPWLLDLHRFLGALTVVFVGVHVLGLWADSYVEFTAAHLFLPFSSPWKTAAVAWGVVAFYLILAVEVTSLLRPRLPARWWRAVHLTSYPLYALATVHLLQAGTDRTNPVVLGAAWASVGAVAFFTVYRLVGPGRGASLRPARSPRSRRDGERPDVGGQPRGDEVGPIGPQVGARGAERVRLEALGQLARPGDGGGLDLVGRDDHVEVARVAGVVGAEHRGQVHRRGAVAVGQPVVGEADREAGHGHPDGDLVHAELEVAGRTDAHVAREEQDGPEGEGVAGAAEHHREGEPVEAEAEIAPRLEQHAGLVHPRPHGGQVEAGREAAGPAEQGNRPGVALGVVEGTVERLDEGVGVRVGLAVVDADDGDVADHVVGDRGGGGFTHGRRR